MATQSTLSWEQYQALPPEKRSRPLTPAEYAAAMQSQEGGAPADFNGPVFPNPDHIQISDDTESGIPDLRLPNGVKAVTGAYNGTPKLDSSNPASAQVLPAAMQTVGAKTTVPPQSLPADFNQWDKAPDTLPADFDKWDAHTSAQETHTPEQKGLLRQAWDWANNGLISGDTLLNLAGELTPNKPKDMKPGESTVDYMKRVRDEVDPDHPWLQGIKSGLAGVNLDAFNVASGFTSPVSIATLLAGPASKAPGALGKAARALSGAASVGFGAKGASDVYEAAADTSKDVPTRLQEGLQGASMVAGGAAAAGENAKPTANAVAERVGPVARKVTPKQAVQAAATLGTVAAGHASPLSVLFEGPVAGKYAGKATEWALGKERANTPILKPKNAAASRVAPESVVEDLEGITSPQTESAGETPVEQVPEETAPSKNAVAARVDTSPKAVKQQLEKSLGATPAQKPIPGVKIKNQPTASGTKLPEGFTTAKESSVVKGYKYDPAAKEFELITHNGQHYVRGDVAPEAAAQFEKTAQESPGSAWNELRNNPQGGTGQFKVVNGKRVAVSKPQSMRSVELDPETGQPEFSDVLEQKRKNLQDFITPEKEVKPAAKTKAKSAAPAEDDLLSKLQQSVDQVKAGKGGVMASAAPEELTKRWGVDEKSLKAGREQTRGWTPIETEAELKKLEARYRKGQPVEPVMETRDANNNLIDVDGRGRAIAAKRAGVKRIPVIVRRIGVQ